ncbi:hypothetical protein ACI78R_22850 [Geodermatophilus sp. SYSU D01106]
MTDRLHPGGVPRVPAGRRRLATAGAGLLLVAVCGLAAAWGRATLDTDGVAVAATVSAVLLVVALRLWSRVRREVVTRPVLEGTVLTGRTPLGRHGVDLTRVHAAAVSWDAESRRVVALGLADDGGCAVVPWAQLQAMPDLAEVRRLLALRQEQRALVLPAPVCAAWDLPALPGADATGPLPRDRVERVLAGLTHAGSAAAVAAGILLA